MSTVACRIVELRRYALHPGARETLIELFDREFIETQEDVGMHVFGQFRDLDDPDSFVWLRGFSDMRTRRRALEAFYGGPVWKEHAPAANATMIDSDNVLLLRPVSGLTRDLGRRPGPGATVALPGLVSITIYRPTASASGAFSTFFSRELMPALREAGVSVLATYATEPSHNTFPALPVRDDDVFVWMAIFADEEDRRRHVAELERSAAWSDRIAPALTQRLRGEAEVLRLTPTARSLIHG